MLEKKYLEFIAIIFIKLIHGNSLIFIPLKWEFCKLNAIDEAHHNKEAAEARHTFVHIL
jgi:hypothetical protein